MNMALVTVLESAVAACEISSPSTHLHVDFVPYTTDSKRGLDTRVSLKQALANQGFACGTKGDTEWNQWVKSEREQLALVMERYGVEWEQLGTHNEHFSVLDYKKVQRSNEVGRVLLAMKMWVIFQTGWRLLLRTVLYRGNSFFRRVLEVNTRRVSRVVASTEKSRHPAFFAC